jgi:hypothetical protein
MLHQIVRRNNTDDIVQLRLQMLSSLGILRYSPLNSMRPTYVIGYAQASLLSMLSIWVARVDVRVCGKSQDLGIASRIGKWPRSKA